MHCLLKNLSALEKREFINTNQLINRVTIQKSYYVFQVKEKILPRRFQSFSFSSNSLTTEIQAQEQLGRVLCAFKSP